MPFSNMDNLVADEKSLVGGPSEADEKSMLSRMTKEPHIYAPGGVSSPDAAAGQHWNEKKASDTPLKSGSEFRVQIERTLDELIGLDIDLIDGISAVVVDVKAGAVHKWNEAHHDSKIQVNDRIVEVNGVRSDANSIVSKLKRDTVWNLVLQRPSEFRVTINRASAPSLGMDLRYAPNGTSLMITAVGDGPMQEWNNANKNVTVKKYDRIIELNGTRGTPQRLLQASEGVEKLDMVIVHYGD